MQKAPALVAALLLAVLVPLSSAFAAQPAPPMDEETARRLGALDAALDELRSPVYDTRPEDRSHRGARLNDAFVALTGEAINPLFGVTALGMYTYLTTPDHLRASLPIYDQPLVWAPLLCIILLMLFNSTICEAMPFLKIPLNALGDIVNKAGAVAVLPLVVKMFADAAAGPAATRIAQAADVVFPAAYAAEGGLSAVWQPIGWLAGAAVGLLIYGAVWLTFNVVDVLILVCPFPGVDALLKSFRLGVLGLLAGVHQVSPAAAAVIAAVVVVVSLFLAGWSFRLSAFGLIHSLDILLFRRRDVGEGDVGAFSCAALASRGVPMRTWGRLERDGDGELAFSYRPWLVLSRRRVSLGKPDAFAAGRGLLAPFVVADANPDLPWLRLPPRYRAQEDALAARFGLARVVNCGVSGALRSWINELFAGAAKTEPAAG